MTSRNYEDQTYMPWAQFVLVTRCDAVGFGTALQAGPAITDGVIEIFNWLWPGGDLSTNRNDCQGISWGVKAASA
jgi:hypothetical protein